MFERFTPAARAIVVYAQEESQTLGQREIMAEHLLLSILADETSIGARIMRDLGVRRESLVHEINSPGFADEEALRSIGIDLQAVRRQAEAAFGPGAWDRPTPTRRSRWRRSARRGGHIPFAAPAKQALEQSLHQATALGHENIDADHLLLGMLAGDDDSAARTLSRIGADPHVIRDRVRQELRRTA